MDEIILVGAGGHARSCIDVIELSGQYKIAGLVEKDNKDGQENLGYPILGSDDDLRVLRQKYSHAFVTVGQIKSPETRIILFQRLQELDYQFPVIVSPRAYVSKNAQISKGTIVLHDAMVNANAKVGKNCIINNKALIEHDALIGDHCHIATGAIVNGKVAVGNESFIGSGAVTKQSISIGNNCVIGAGVVVKIDLEPDQVIKN
jgi:sugar O-acyltransferase (sialic acid O-acetyltransferase NeuD family)|tara:strand:+ start:2203 stop:2814 length:612 start_codon:yes stop_codon:yes gene_type:complete